MKLVVDASVALKWTLLEDGTEADVDAARALLAKILNGTHVLVQPPHWIVEVLAVMARRSPGQVAASLAALRDINADIANDDRVFLQAAELAERLKQHLFDTLYHAVALNRGAILVTADERYWAIARKDGAIQRLRDMPNTDI